jgi:DpnII restriction endonuclease
MTYEEVLAALDGYNRELEGILSRFKKDHNGIHIQDRDDGRFREMALELLHLFEDEFVNGGRHSQVLTAYFNDSTYNMSGTPSYQGVENVKGVVGSALVRVQRNPMAIKSRALVRRARGAKDSDVVVTIAERLHRVVRQLRQRRESRPTLDVNDEYDVQDLFHALLLLHFDDVREEEWAPSYAGLATRMDFLLPEIEAVVEIKMTRPSMSKKQLSEQLIIDIAKYKSHPHCRTLFCVVYDPEGRIANPRGVENDLSTETQEMVTRVMIVPKN